MRVRLFQATVQAVESRNADVADFQTNRLGQLLGFNLSWPVYKLGQR